MRHPFLLSTVLGLVAAMPALAQSYPAEAVILQRDVEVRSGPGKGFYATSKLNQNEKVLVLREVKDQPGWLEIKPPSRSFSWINGKYIKQVDARHAYVETDASRPVSTYAGSRVVDLQPTRESMKLTAGTVLIIADPPLTINGETWFPVEPNPSEVRYIQSDAVRAVQSETVSAPKWNPGPNGYNANKALADAEAALSNNDTNRARQLFQQVSTSSQDANQRQYALNRLASLGNGPQVPGTTTSLSPANIANQANLQVLKQAEWSAYGRLRDTKVLSDNGQPLYALEDGMGKTPIYVTNLPGKSLQAYVGRTVAVYGPTMYRADAAVRMQYVVASHVAVP